jgi:O-antigen ligase
MVYNFVLREKGWETIFKILAVTNALVLGYCALQVVFGAERVMFFGISEWGFSTTATTGGEEISGRRVTGPFAATALTAEYFTIQIMIWAYFLIHVKEKRPRILLSVLIALNIGFLVATGNRGGFVSLVIGSLGYLFLFRKQLGLRRMVTISTRGIMLFAAMSIVVVTYTDFNSLYERLASTQFGRGFIPDSRQGWFYIWEFVVEKPFLGHGPRLAILGYQQITYPHNLFMYLFYTLGGVGLVAYAYFFVKIWRRYSRAKRYRVADKMLSGMPRLGLLILVIFLASQMRIELMRFVLHDYQQYFFMILAVFLAFSDMVRIRSLRSQPAPRRKRQVVLQTAMHDGS